MKKKNMEEQLEQLGLEQITKFAEIKGDFNGEVLTRKAFTQSQAYLIIEQLKRDGVRNIRCDFNAMDKLPNGVNLHDKYR